jgi:hypothetical protein
MGTSSGSTDSTSPGAVGEFCSIDELVEIIGAGEIDRKSLYNAARRGDLAGTRRIGKRFLVHVPTFMNWFRTAGQTVAVATSTATEP